MKLNLKKAALIVLSMVGVAMFDSLKGVFLPNFISHYQVSYSLIGVLFLSTSLAYMVGSYFAGKVISRVGKARTIQFTALLTCLGLAAIVVVHSMVGLFSGFILVGFASAATAMVINTTIPQLEVKNQAFLMNLVHFTYGVGATLTVRFAGALIARNWQYPSVYSLTLALFAAMFLLSLRVHLPETVERDAAQTPFDSLQKKLIVLFGLALGFYVIAEIQTGSWLINYIVKSYRLSENEASTYMSLFFLLLALGRLAGGFVADRLGYLKTVTLSLIVAIALYLVGLSAGRDGLIIIACSGLFFSICFPTITLSQKLYFPGQLSRAMGLIMTISVGMNVLSNYLMGWLTDSLGVFRAMFVMPSTLAISALLLILIQLRFKTN